MSHFTLVVQIASSEGATTVPLGYKARFLRRNPHEGGDLCTPLLRFQPPDLECDSVKLECFLLKGGSIFDLEFDACLSLNPFFKRVLNGFHFSYQVGIFD
jgi:hypothetical protein